MRRVQFRVRRTSWDFDPLQDHLDIHIFDPDARAVLQTDALPFVPLTPDAPVSPPIRLSTTDAQSLMDQLWDCGLRPTEGKGSAGSLAAVERHLEDMRKLVFESKDRLRGFIP
jgi:hypothetical protein